MQRPARTRRRGRLHHHADPAWQPRLGVPSATGRTADESTVSAALYLFIGAFGDSVVVPPVRAGGAPYAPSCAAEPGVCVGAGRRRQEKGLATPQQYPLTINALQSACNQTSNREPVVSYDETAVLDALHELKDQKLVRFVLPSHGRSVVRYRQVLDETLGLDDRSAPSSPCFPPTWPADGRRATHPHRTHDHVRQPRRDTASARFPLRLARNLSRTTPDAVPGKRRNAGPPRSSLTGPSTRTRRSTVVPVPPRSRVHRRHRRPAIRVDRAQG